ncbi:MAG TPA: dephospho-CoA kinase [Candidatus Tetragenococcus pullicola]|nr:dephospho-CoA kinase [Candidatus Tetragenococcus pullicola]
MTFILGVTGGIATGKSTAIQRFREYGFPIIDADQVAREVVEPNTIGLKKIVAEFGRSILLDSGTLNRKKLGKIVFSDPKKREKLDQLLDKEIRTNITQKIKAFEENFTLIVVDIPLLYEADYTGFFDQIAVVYLPQKIQKNRLKKRDRLTDQEADQRLKSQFSIEEKKKSADIVFDNQDNVKNLYQQIDRWLKKMEFI